MKTLIRISLVIDLVCIVMILATSYFVASKKESREKRLALLCMAVSFLYCITEIMELAFTAMRSVSLLMFNDMCSLIIMIFLAGMYFCYIISATRLKIPRRGIYAYITLFGIAELILLTRRTHLQLYKAVEVVENQSGLPQVHMIWGLGFYYIVILLFLNGFLILGIGLYHYRRACKDKKNRDKRKRSLSLLCVSTMPILILILFYYDYSTIFDPVCIGMGVSALLLLRAIRHYNYLNVVQSGIDLVVENMSCGILIFDKGYHFLEANRFVREKFAEIWDRPELLEEKADIKAVLEGNGSRVEWKSRIYSCQRYEVQSQSNVLSGYAITLYDITEQENHIAELQKLKEEAEKANSQKTRFLTNVTHEIRTPMNTILGMSEIAVRKNMAKDLEGPLKTIYHEGEGVLEMIDTLLDISKLESGTIELTHEMYSMEEILYEIANMVYMRIDEKDLDYKVEIGPQFPRAFYGDRMRVKEIFQNLLGNAIKYTECGNITLMLDGEKEGGRFRIQLTVKDTGIGMSENDREDIFKRFMRCKNPKMNSVFGAGLGLNITMQLVKLMEGDIQVQSRQGEGTTFMASFYQEIADSEPLWLKDMNREKVESHMEHNSFLDQIHVVFPGAHVLLVDDMESNLKVEQGLMQLYEIEPEMALSGKDALRLVENRKYDIIFLDHMMPGMDGIETLSRLRDLENGKEVPIVAITANAVAYNSNFYEENGFDDSLTKPLHTAELLEVLKKYIPSKIQNKEIEESDENLPIKSLMPEIDCAQGIKNIGGSLEKYNDLLQVYYKEMSQILEVLSDLAEEDLEQFKIKVHGIKGSSRNIGAQQLSNSALQMEEWAKNDKKEEILAQLDTFLKELDAVMTRINAYLKETVENIERDGEFLPELELTSVYAILRALSEFDMDEVEEELKELYKNRYTDDTEAVLEELKRYIEDLDYLHATELLEDYLKNIG